MGIARVCPIFLALASMLAVACGDDGGPEVPEAPRPGEVRGLYGLNPGSCFTYRFDTPSGSAFAVVQVEGPNERVVDGQKLYLISYLQAAGGLPTQTYLDADGEAGALRLIRHVEGTGTARTTKTFVDIRTGEKTGEVGPPPVFARFSRQSDGVVSMDTAEIETLSQPLVTTAGTGELTLAESEQHRWRVLGEETDIAVHDGTRTAIKMAYTRGGKNALYWLVPGYGFAKFSDFDNVSHQVCDARICDADGNCVGPDTCQTSCPL